MVVVLWCPGSWGGGVGAETAVVTLVTICWEQFPVSGSACKEVGIQHSILTICKKLDRLKNHHFLEPYQRWGGRGKTTTSKIGVTNKITQGVTGRKPSGKQARVEKPEL